MMRYKWLIALCVALTCSTALATQYLRQGTAATIMFGPFVDKADGVTLKTDSTTITDIDHATTGIFLSKNGGAAAIRHATVTASVADAYGMMKVTLDATDTNTAGSLDVLFAKAATYLPVSKTYMVVNANVYDSLYKDTGTDLLDVSVAQIAGQTASAAGAVAFPATIASPTNILDQSLTGHGTAGSVGGALTYMDYSVADTYAAVGTTDSHVTQNALLIGPLQGGDSLSVALAAVKAKTDPLTFTVTNKLDSNVYAWNGTAVHTPTTVGYPDVNISKIGGQTVTAAAPVTVPATIGTSTYAGGDTPGTTTLLSFIAYLQDILSKLAMMIEPTE